MKTQLSETGKDEPSCFLCQSSNFIQFLKMKSEQNSVVCYDDIDD